MIKPTFLRRVAIAALLSGSCFSAAAAPPAPPVSYGVEEDVFHPVRAKQGMVASVDATATQVGVDILKEGGNAVDAAVAVGYALAVTHPQAGNLGGGGFMLIRSKNGNTTAIDFREMAPAKATRDMFLDDQGNPDSKKSLTSHLASGTPGTVAGFSLALDKYGTMPLNKVVQPAFKLARDGFIVNDALADDLKTYGSEVLPNHENSKAIFWKEGEPLKKGDTLVQANLAKSLEMIAENGPDEFYKGTIAEQIAQEQKNGGLITKEDLAAYKAVERTPISGDYRGYQVYSMPPPSSGGIHIVQILNILENFDMKKYGFGSADAMQIMAEAEKYAYADRSEYLGDPDFVKVPWQALTNKAYAKSIADQIDIKKAKPSSEIRPGKLAPYESNQTTHYSVVDKDGNAVAVTYTLNTTFGTGIVAGESGILLNNQMDDFSAKPGVPNVYGLVGGDANAVGPNKRPLSSMSPTIVVKDGKTWLVTGSPGGSRIITTVLQMVVNSIDYGMNVAEATNAPRFHHQWLPDELRVEKGFSPDTLKLLEAKGQKVALKEAMGSTQSIMVGPDGELYGASDPRSVDDLTAGY